MGKSRVAKIFMSASRWSVALAALLLLAIIMQWLGQAYVTKVAWTLFLPLNRVSLLLLMAIICALTAFLPYRALVNDFCATSTSADTGTRIGGNTRFGLVFTCLNIWTKGNGALGSVSFNRTNRTK
jgi:hypothetical protein